MLLALIKPRFYVEAVAGLRRLLQTGKRTLLKSSAKVQKIIDIRKHFTTYSVFFAQNYSTYSYFVRQKHTTYSNIDRMGIQELADDHEASSAVRSVS